MRSPVETTRCSGGVSCPKARTLDIQPQPAEQFGRVIQTKASAFEQLQFVVEPFDEAAGMPALEIVENSVPPVVPGVDELVKTTQKLYKNSIT